MKRSAQLLITLVTSLTVLSCNSERYAVVFDVTNTVMTVKEKGPQSMEEEVANIPGITTSGFLHAISNFCFSKRAAIEAIEHDFRTLLVSFGEQSGSPELMVRDHNNVAVPLILTEWLRGNVSSPRLIGLLQDRAHYAVLRKIAATVFNSSIIARYTIPLHSGIQFLEKIARMLNSHDIFIMGNWEKESFEYATQKSSLRTIFNHIPRENRIISSSVHLLMPRNSAEFFALISTQADLPYDHIIFISTIPAHINASAKVGVKTIQVYNHNFDAAWQIFSTITP